MFQLVVAQSAPVACKGLIKTLVAYRGVGKELNTEFLFWDDRDPVIYVSLGCSIFVRNTTLLSE